MSGSQVISGSLTVFTGSLIEFQVTNTGTKIGNAITDIHTVTGSLSVSGSQTFIGTKTITGSVFISGSKTLIGTNTVTGSMLISGSLDINGPITATTLIVQTITSSVDFVTGSTRFGSLSSNTHVFTGSMYVTGAFYVSTGSVGIGTVSPSQKLEVVGGEIKAGRVDSSQEGGQVSFGRASDNNTSWYIDLYGSSTSPQLRFVDVDNSAVRMTLTGSNIGIGTSTPGSKLTVSGDLSVQAGTLSAFGIGLQMNSTFAFSGNAYRTAIFSYNTGDGNGIQLGYDASAGTGIVASSTNGAGAALAFWTYNGSWAEKMKLAKEGYLTVEGNGNGWTIGQASGVNRIDYTSSTFRCLSTANSFTPIAASAFNVNSDYRLKEDLKDFNNSLSIVNSIKIYDFKWKDRDERNYGVMAHELQEVLPYTVHGEKDDLENDGSIRTQGVDYGKLVPVLVKAIQELKAQNDALQSRIETLESK